MRDHMVHAHETTPRSHELAIQTPKTGATAEVVVHKNHTRGRVASALTGGAISISSLFHVSPVDAAQKQSDAQVLAGTPAEKKEENAAVAALKFQKFTTIQSLKDEIKKGKMVLVKNGHDYILKGIGEMDPSHKDVYASLRPHTKQLLDTIARQFYSKFKEKLTLTSLTRTESYVDILRKTNKNASKTSTHMYGTTFDCTKNGMTQTQLEWMRTLLAAMERSGKIVATEEWVQPCFHVVDIQANKK